MSHYFQIDELVFYPQKNEVHKGKQVLKVRPKTAELLIILLEARGGIVSKTDLLNLVWNDVIVKEYVVFQSIAELRKIFDGVSVIKTHPRKGYSISSTIKECNEQPIEITPESIANKKLKKSFNINYVYLLVTCFIIVLSVLFYKYQSDDIKGISEHNSVLILPVKNNIAGSEHFWIRYGGMDLSIKYLQPHITDPVLPAEITLDIIKRADINLREIDEEAIARLFEVSGAEIIVSQAISGFSGDYQLVYSIYDKQRVKRGVLFADDTTVLFSDLNSVLLESLGVEEKNDEQQYGHSFANSLMAAAIDEMQSENYQEAATMFEAVLVTEPRNLLAVKLLVKSLIFLGEYEEAETVAATSIELAQQNPDQKQLGRLLFWQAVSIVQQGKYDDTLSVLANAIAKNEQTNDLLYLANASRIKGKVYLQQKKYEQAKEEILKALSMYRAIKEPYGQSSMYIDLGELELAKNNIAEATKSFNTALKLAEKSRLRQLINISNEWIKKANAVQQ